MVLCVVTSVASVAFAALWLRERLDKSVPAVKEVPVVKVLDSPNIPDKKSFPPRTLVTILGTAFTLALGTTWILGKASWEQMDSTDPRKAFAQEVFTTLKASLPQFSRNGLGKPSSEEEPTSWIPRGQDKQGPR